MKIHHHYNSIHHGLQSATVIINYLGENLGVRPKSVIDVGCGLGQWLYTYNMKYGSQVLGVDGQHVPREDSFIEEENRLRCDLQDFIVSETAERFDLSLCLEVAEHLEESLADSLVEKLTSLGDIIVFSAAIPGQTGEQHVNEQPHRYWLEKFEKRGFQIFDPFRKEFWNDPRVNWWYAQNMFLICRMSACPERAKCHCYDGNMYVHPRLLELHHINASRSSRRRDISMLTRAISVIGRIRR
jgi:SAM-dependent methyltransferase